MKKHLKFLLLVAISMLLNIAFILVSHKLGFNKDDGYFAVLVAFSVFNSLVILLAMGLL